MGNSSRISGYLYIEYLRVLCAFAVIIVHVSGANWFKIEIGSTNWIVQTFFNLAGRFSVCVFCMITGALLLRPGKDISIHDLVSHYIKRIMICYIAWVILYAILYTILDHENFQYFILRLFKQPDHLWYLLMLTGLYLIYPILNIIAKNRDVTRYMILLLVAFGTLNTVSGITGFFDELASESYLYSLWKPFLGNLGTINVAFVPGYVALFLLGHYIHEYGLGSWHKVIVYSSIPALLLSGLLTVWISILTQRGVYTFMLEANPLVFLASAGIFAFFRGNGSEAVKAEPGTPISKAMVWIAGNTFGIYLIHFAIREIMAKGFDFDVASYPAALSVPINSLLIFAISLLLTALLKRIPGVRKILS
ncbi:MAG: acyltransferase family protein [Lachnospiraceae bacterium]|nr:acyltransferase family protein [Lachnospiraceae bacterium]